VEAGWAAAYAVVRPVAASAMAAATAPETAAPLRTPDADGVTVENTETAENTENLDIESPHCRARPRGV
ncbi:hypothetical protein, partial [Streptomyces acidiscabies]|uniref:hypothetical protein n=1 Tax=Streptomyces acidiscabies TaxID=42234 RepID=UPI000B277F22